MLLLPFSLMLFTGFKYMTNLNKHDYMSGGILVFAFVFFAFVFLQGWLFNMKPCLSDDPKFVNYARK